MQRDVCYRRRTSSMRSPDTHREKRISFRRTTRRLRLACDRSPFTDPSARIAPILPRSRQHSYIIRSVATRASGVTSRCVRVLMCVWVAGHCHFLPLYQQHTTPITNANTNAPTTIVSLVTLSPTLSGIEGSTFYPFYIPV
jgi:hypothetical protein